MKKLEKEIKKAIVEWFNSLEQYNCYTDLKESLYEWLYDVAKDASWDWDKTKEIFNRLFDDIAEDYLLNQIKRKFQFPFGVAMGIEHVNTPYRYYLEYIEENVNSIEELKQRITEHTRPHAWGILGNYNGWGNYAFEVFKNIDDLKKIKNQQESYYYTVLTVLGTYGET